MKFKYFISVGITVACAVVFVIVAAIDQKSRTQIESDELFFPNLLDQVNEIAQIRIQTAQREINVRLVDDVWRVQQQSSYFADFKKVQNVIVSMSQVRKLEKKTREAERFAELDLAGVDIENSQTVQIQLISAQNEVMADLLLGKSKSSQSNPQLRLMYVRSPELTQAWLTETALEVPTESLDWINREIIDINDDRVSEVQLILPKQADVRVFQSNEDVRKFDLADVPQGFQVRHQFLVNNIGGLFKKLIFERVAEVSGWQSSSEIRMKTLDGLIITAYVGSDSLSQHAMFEAKAEKDASAEILKEIQQLNRNWDGWAFQLSKVRINTAKTAFEELIEPQVNTLNQRIER